MRKADTDITIKSVSHRYHFGGFHCGIPSINQYLLSALSQARRTERIYVALNESKTISGFYALSACSIEFEDEDYSLGTSRTHFAARIMALAVDRRMTDHGIARLLLGHALRKIHSVILEHDLNIDVVLCDTPNPRAKAFYLHYGFIALPGMAKAVFMPIRSLDHYLGSPQ
jgi:GNAT superfamily N-acetyltransferase